MESNTCYDEWSDCPQLSDHSCFRHNATCLKSCGLRKGMTPKESNYCYNDPAYRCQTLAENMCAVKNVHQACLKKCGRCKGDTPKTCFDRAEGCSASSCTSPQRIYCLKTCKMCKG